MDAESFAVCILSPCYAQLMIMLEGSLLMETRTPDLEVEQQASLHRDRYPYTLLAQAFYYGMDLFAGKATTLSKAKLLEIFAGVPYRAWELGHYRRMTRRYGDRELVRRSWDVVTWAREAQDNEIFHLFVINEKMKEEGEKDTWYLTRPIPALMMFVYWAFARLMAWFGMDKAFLFNAQFEDHAEHNYAQFVEDHPEWDAQPVTSALVREYGDFATWGDVFRRIALDEREHRNHSFVLAGRPEYVAELVVGDVSPGDGS
jgi:ubiquinol oxidase